MHTIHACSTLHDAISISEMERRVQRAAVVGNNPEDLLKKHEAVTVSHVHARGTLKLLGAVRLNLEVDAHGWYPN